MAKTRSPVLINKGIQIRAIKINTIFASWLAPVNNGILTFDLS
jgi:hypothetical protein